jgi:hypothetical protein
MILTGIDARVEHYGLRMERWWNDNEWELRVGGMKLTGIGAWVE